MKKLLLGIIFTSLASFGFCQELSCENLLNLLSLNETRQESQLSKKAFFSKRAQTISDTVIKVYKWGNKTSKKPIDSVTRNLIKKSFSGTSSFTYQTASAAECKAIKDDLEKAGFYFLNKLEDISDTTTILFQHLNFTSRFYVERIDSSLLYSFDFFKKSFPDPADMYYADDLLHFTSHEYLVYFFGEQNVKKDICFFADDQIARCSVLFLNTNRQVVFIWEDEVNKCSISSLLIGGQQKLKSQQDYDKYIAENNWLLKSGIHAGMSLYELRLLHGTDIMFYGGNAINSGEILSKNKGNLNFAKENVILGCMNCKDNKFASASIISADEALKDGRILFVLSIAVKPNADQSNQTPAAGNR